ncbi:hypothetical protein ACROYT_G042021 [Oculina patagonica]
MLTEIVCCVFFLLSSLVNKTRCSPEINTLQQSFGQCQFSKHEFHYLNVLGVGTVMVYDDFDCIFECLRNSLCFSVNLAASKGADGKLWCELLSSDKYHSADEYTENKTSHHFAIMVTCGLLQAFTYIKWPGSLQVIAKYSGILQMDVLQIAPIHCLYSRFRADAFESLFMTMAINAAVIGLSVAFYGIRKVIILRSVNLQGSEKSRRISYTKELVLRNLFFFLYMTYLTTCVKTANVLPIACQELCRDKEEELCYKYMKADYSIQCQGTKYNHWLILAYISTAYIVALPVSSFIVLWRQRRVTAHTNPLRDQGPGMEMTSGLRFLFENYKHRSWYWELVEMSRKVILTSGLILVGQESRSYIGLAWVTAGMYGMLFSWIEPILDVTENRLMATSLAVTVVNLGIGAVSRIPAENLPTSTDKYTDAVLFKMLVIGANTLVIGLIVAQYAVFLYGYLKERRKNPHWSFSCCLALLLPLNDLQGEIRGITGADVLKNQLQTGQIDKPTIAAALKEIGAFDVTLEGGVKDAEGDVNPIDLQDGTCQVIEGLDEHKNARRHQETQTELYSLSIADFVIHGSMTEPHHELDSS